MDLNPYLAVRSPYAQRHRSLNKAISADETFFKFELAPHDYTTLCTRISCKRHRRKWNAKNIFFKCYCGFFFCKYNGQYIASPKMIEVINILIIATGLTKCVLHDFSWYMCYFRWFLTKDAGGCNITFPVFPITQLLSVLSSLKLLKDSRNWNG